MSRQSQGAILVTGADGFIGRHVCEALKRAGRRVLATDVGFAEPPLGEGLSGDLTDDAFVAQIFERHSIHVIVHLASLLNSASRAEPSQALRVNMCASASLLEHAAQLHECRFVYGSSISAYGTKLVRDCGPASEASPPAPTDIYGISKRFVELAGETLAAKSGLEFVALRIPIVIGAGITSGASRWRSQIFELLGAREDVEITLPFPATEAIPVTHVEDVAEALCALALRPRLGHALYNAPAENLSCGELARAIRGHNQRICFRFGEIGVDGIPQAIDAARFVGEMGLDQTPLADHLKALPLSSR